MQNKIMSVVLLISILFMSGCSDFMHVKEVRHVYKARQTRPDGVVYRNWIIKSKTPIEIGTTRGGHSYIYRFYDRTLTPPGWHLEISREDIEDLGPEYLIDDDYDNGFKR